MEHRKSFTGWLKSIKKEKSLTEIAKRDHMLCLGGCGKTIYRIDLYCKKCTVDLLTSGVINKQKNAKT